MLNSYTKDQKQAQNGPEGSINLLLWGQGLLWLTDTVRADVCLSSPPSLYSFSAEWNLLLLHFSVFISKLFKYVCQVPTLPTFSTYRWANKVCVEELQSLLSVRK